MRANSCKPGQWRSLAVALALLFAVPSAGTGALGAAPDPDAATDVVRAGPRVLLRNFALAACLGDAFPPIRDEASAAAGGYMAYGKASFEAHLAARALAETFLARPYASKSGASLAVMKCIDLSHSPELDALVNRYLPGPGLRRASPR